MRKIVEFSDGSVIEQGRGKFDDYCVYLTRPERERYAPTDVEYFSFFIRKSSQYSSEKIYEDFVKIYNKTTSDIKREVFREIEVMCQEYQENEWLDFMIWYSVIYLGMVAEERKAYAVLKKRMKRLGMHQILFENMEAREAAVFSRGRKAVELAGMCRERGF